jgi:hypothetical protein
MIVRDRSGDSARVSKYAVGFVIAGGVIWVIGAVLYGAMVVSCFSCGSVVLGPGIATTGYPPSAIRNLAWDDLYANLYVGTIGVLVIAIGLKAFRRGEKWAWYSIAVFVLAGVLTGLLDYLSWGGWYTFLFLGLPSLVGLALSAKSFFPGRSDVASTPC